MIQGIIFDFDGTLFDSNPVWKQAGEDFFQSMGRTPKPDFHETVRTMTLLQSARHIQEEYGIPLSVEEIMERINKSIERAYFWEIQPKPGVVSFLEQLRRRGIPMCIATATDRYLVAAALTRCGMDAFFGAIFTCGEVGHGKEEPHIFREALAFLGTEPRATVVVEDSLHGILTAKQDGFLTVGVYDPDTKDPQALLAQSHCYLPDYTHLEPFWKLASAP